MFNNRTILYLSPHTDDVEVSCGASLSKLIENNNIYVCCFSAATKSLPKGFPVETTELEFYKSNEILKLEIFQRLDKTY
jgi:LmbE family N-acetylglucosaminyl deacetylase